MVTKKRTPKKLGISRRQIDHLIIKYKEKGKSAFVHGNRNKKPASTLDKPISEDIILLYKNKYQDWNFQHFKGFLEKNENIKVFYNFIYITFQDRLVNELKLNGITTIEEANKYLLNVFIPYFNKRFAMDYK